LAKQAEVNKMLKDMEEWGVIEGSDSPWSLPVVLVQKKNGDFRFYVDNRKLNVVTKKEGLMTHWTLLPEPSGS
jgi:hypothetical protein